MFVCVCKAVSDRRIREASLNGVCSVRELRLQLGLGSVCGKCVPAARALLDEVVQKSPGVTAAAAEPRWGAESF